MTRPVSCEYLRDHEDDGVDVCTFLVPTVDNLIDIPFAFALFQPLGGNSATYQVIMPVL